MKIAFLHLTMGLVERGSEVVVDQLATALAKSHEVLLIQAGPVTKKPYKVVRVTPINKAPEAAPKNIFEKLLYRLHLDNESSHVVDFTKAAIPTLIKFAPDIIVAINGPLQVRILSGVSRKAKIAVFGHAGIGYHDKDSIRSQPDLFVALTPPAESWAGKLAKRGTRVVYIPNPIDIQTYKNVSPAPLSLDKPIVLTVSALSAYKNVLNVVSAIKHISTSFLLIGDGEQGSTLSKAFSKLANSFLWVKHLDPSLMPSYYRTADVFCFVPDPQEAFGMVYLEAMVAGLPIVASDDPVRRGIIGQQGIYVDPHNEQEIVSGINQALKLGKLDYSQELKQYELKTIVKRIEKEFHELIK